jgi:subtilisin family serine protease
MKSGCLTAVLCALALAASGAALAQGVPSQSPPARGGGSALGIEIDLGALWRAGRALLAARARDAPAHAPDRLLAVYALDAARIAPQAFGIDDGVQVLGETELPALGLRVVELRVEPARLLEIAERLRQALPAVTIDVDAYWQPADGGALPARIGRLYAAPMVGVAAPETLARAVRIAVIDGDLDESVGLQVALLARASFAQAAAGVEHGTAVACLIACRTRGDGDARFFGLAQGAALLHAAVLQEDGGRALARTLSVLRALDWALAGRAELLHFSLGAPPNAVIAHAIAAARRKTQAIVAAAGNGGPQGAPLYPAALEGVIAVAAVDAAGRPYRDGTRGAHVALAAPGVDVWVPQPAVEAGQYVSGTSFAAPLVTAILAQRLARALPVDGDALCRAAQDLPPPGRDPATGCGLLRAPASGASQAPPVH